MMDQAVQPCLAGYSPADIITAAGAVATTCFTAFLSYRRVRKDRLDVERWSICPLLGEGRPPTRHRHVKSRARSDDET